MPRANRYFLPGYIWNITHPCHKKEFLLKFSRYRKDRRAQKPTGIAPHTHGINNRFMMFGGLLNKQDTHPSA